MGCRICTIGFAGKAAEEFFRLLTEAGIRKVIDIRQNRGGQLSGFAKHPDLAFFLDRIAGISYVHEPLLAPTPELLKSYRAERDWELYEVRFLALMKERGVPGALDTSGWGEAPALLCSEPGPEKCHRRLVADLIAERWRANGNRVEIEHLGTPPAVLRRRKRNHSLE
jgi:uncharacterized protein (DUF488 family)